MLLLKLWPVCGITIRSQPLLVDITAPELEPDPTVTLSAGHRPLGPVLCSRPYRLAVNLLLRLLLLLVLALMAPLSLALSFDVRGVSGAARDNVQVFLDTRLRRLPDSEAAARRRIESTAREALRAVGYYRPQLNISRQADDEWLVEIKAGQPVRVRELKVTVSGEGEQDPSYRRYLRRLPLKQGDLLHHGHYESIKQQLQSIAAQHGYFDARFSERTLEVDVDNHSARVVIRFDSGARYHFGEISISGSQIDEARVRQLISAREGEPYDVSKLAATSQRLARSQWFDSSRVLPSRGEADEARTVPVAIELAPRVANAIETKFGWATDTGPRVGLAWNKPWVNSAGHSLSTSVEWSEPIQNVEVTYRVPGDDPLDDYYEAAVGSEVVNNNDTDSRSYSVQLGRHSEWRNSLRSYTLRWLHEDFVQANDSGKVDLYLPGWSFQRLRTVGKATDPSRVDKMLATVEATDEAIGSDIRLLSLRGRAGVQWRLFTNHRLLLRVDGGALLTDNFDQVPYSMRFFAGGDQSVRGYDYESIAPTNSAGELVGGRNLLTGSAGYQYRVLDNWWAATFFDAGAAFDTLETTTLSRSVGIGVRWQSPIAPVRVDLAFPLDSDDGGFRLHFALGPEL